MTTAGGAPLRNLHGASLVVQTTHAREASTRAAQDVTVSVCRVYVSLSSVFPLQEVFARILEIYATIF